MTKACYFSYNLLYYLKNYFVGMLKLQHFSETLHIELRHFKDTSIFMLVSLSLEYILTRYKPKNVFVNQNYEYLNSLPDYAY